MQLLSLEDIATELNVYDKSGNFLQKLYIVDYDELIRETIGVYDDRFESWSEYMTEMRVRIKEYIATPYDITWFTLGEDDVYDRDLVAATALKENNDFVILERLQELD